MAWAGHVHGLGKATEVRLDPDTLRGLGYYSIEAGLRAAKRARRCMLRQIREGRLTVPPGHIMQKASLLVYH